MINDLTQGSVLKRLLIFAYPFALSNLLQVVYGIVDMVVIGHFVGSTGLSGASIGGELLNFFTMLGAGFSTSGQVMISQYAGRGDRKGINSVIGTMFSFILGSSLVLSAIALCFTGDFLTLLKTPAEAFKQGYSYAATCFGGLFFIYGYNTVSSILRGMGDSKRPFAFIAIATLTNILLDLVFVGLLGWDTFGAALATVMSQALSFILAIIYLYRRREAFGFVFKPKSFWIGKRQLLPMISLGLPMALQNAAISLSFLFVNSHINSYGVIASAVTGVGAKLSNVMSIVAMAVGMASSTMIGQNFGAGKFERCKKIVHYTLAICLCACAVLVTVYNLFPKQLFGLFSERSGGSLSGARVYKDHVRRLSLVCPHVALRLHDKRYRLCRLLLHSCYLRRGRVKNRNGAAVRQGLGNGITGFWLGSALAAFTTAFMAAVYFYAGPGKSVGFLSNNPLVGDLDNCAENPQRYL
jgi:putative MATE family efflux protein